MSDSERPVEVATFLYVHEAEMARALLEARGIEAFVQDGEMARANWMLATAIGGVKLEVAAADARRAVEILEADHSGEPVDWEERPETVGGGPAPPTGEATGAARPEDETCPGCGSRDVTFRRFSKGAIILTILFLGVPILILRRRFTCNSCLRTWKEGEGIPAPDPDP